MQLRKPPINGERSKMSSFVEPTLDKPIVNPGRDSFAGQQNNNVDLWELDVPGIKMFTTADRMTPVPTPGILGIAP